MTTRKHPRTMQEAFGPYTSRQIFEPEPPMDWQDRVVVVACVIALVFVALVLFWPANAIPLP